MPVTFQAKCATAGDGKEVTLYALGLGYNKEGCRHYTTAPKAYKIQVIVRCNYS